MNRRSDARSHRQRGTTLPEALIAFGVLSLGILTIGRVQTHLHLGSDIARQRSEAVRLGQEELETLRAFSVIAASAPARSYAEIQSRIVTIDTDSGYATNTRYRLTRDVQAGAMVDAKHIEVDVAWADRSGQDQHVRLASLIAGNDPLYSAALSLTPGGKPVKGAFGRSAWIPLAAKMLADGRSVLKRIGSPTTAVVFDNATGIVVATCSGLDPSAATVDLTAAALVACDAVIGYLISGTVRFSLGAPPSAAQATDTPLPFSVQAAASSGYATIAPSCTSAALKTVAYTSGGASHVDAMPIGATPAALGLATWTETGDRYAAYECLVHPPANGLWSGTTTLVASGWSIGTAESARRICRYSADADGSGAVDANAEHPAQYTSLSGALANQNFLVVAGPQACPSGPPVQIDGTAADVYADLSTVQHQP